MCKRVVLAATIAEYEYQGVAMECSAQTCVCEIARATNSMVDMAKDCPVKVHVAATEHAQSVTAAAISDEREEPNGDKVHLRRVCL